MSSLLLVLSSLPFSSTQQVNITVLFFKSLYLLVGYLYVYVPVLVYM